MENKVSLSYLDEYDINKVEDIVKKILQDLDVQIKPKSKVLLKVCLPVGVSSDLAKTTNPTIVRGVVNVLTQLGAKCVIIDSPYKKFNKENLSQVYLNTGMLEVENLTKCELSYNLKTTTISLPEGKRTKSLTLLEEINEADYIINLSKIKMDFSLGYIGALSNLFGFIPGEVKTLIKNRQTTIKDYNNYLIDIFQAIKDKIILNIADAVVALEADETQRMLSCVLASKNVFSLDACMLKILNLDIKNSCVSLGAERGFVDINNPFCATQDIEKFNIEDFKTYNYDLSKEIHINKNSQKTYFKNTQQRVKIDMKRCKGCQICSKICPANAITMKYDKNNELYAEIDYKKCIFCNKCVTACPYQVVEQITPFNYKKLHQEIEKENA